LNDLNKAISLNGAEPVYYFNRGNVYYDLHDFEKAHEDYDQAIELEPHNPRFWHSKGLAYEGVDAEGNVEQAIRMYKQALLIDEKYFGSRYHLGLMFHLNRQYHDALACFTSVISNYSKDKDIFIKRGRVYQDMGNH
jgi:tetratricopeptide (TPR) repeat protein